MPAVSSGRRQTPPGPEPASSYSLATIPAPLLRSCSSVNSRTGVRKRVVPRPREAVEQEGFQLGQPREVPREPVARPPDRVDRPFDPVLGVGRVPGS